MSDKRIQFTDTFNDKFTVILNESRMAIDIDRRPDGKTPNIVCMTHEDTLKLRDALNEQYPPSQVKTVIGDVHVDSRTPAGITINATGNVIINN